MALLAAGPGRALAQEASVPVRVAASAPASMPGPSPARALAASAEQPDTLTFGSLPRVTEAQPPATFWQRHRSTILITGVALTAASLVASELLLRSADKRYDLYRSSGDPQVLETYYQQARTRDRWSNALLVLGEMTAGGTLMVAWHNPGGRRSELRFSSRPLPSGAAVRLSWSGP